MESPELLGVSSYFAELSALGLPTGGSPREISPTGVSVKPRFKDEPSQLSSRLNTERDNDFSTNRKGVTVANRAQVENLGARDLCNRLFIPGDANATSERRSNSRQKVELTQSRQVAFDSAENLLDIKERLKRMECDTGQNSLNIAAILECLVEMKLEMQQNMSGILRCVAGEKTAPKKAPQEDVQQKILNVKLAGPERVGETVPQSTLRQLGDGIAPSSPNVENFHLQAPAHATPPQMFSAANPTVQTDDSKASEGGGDGIQAMVADVGDVKSSTEELYAFLKCSLQTSLENVEKTVIHEMKSQMVDAMQSLVQDSMIKAPSAPDLQIRAPSTPASLARHCFSSEPRRRSFLGVPSSRPSKGSMLSRADCINLASSDHSTGTHDYGSMDADELHRADKWATKLRHATDKIMAEVAADFETGYRTSLAHVNRHKNEEELRSQRTSLQKILESTLYQSVMLLFVLTQAVGMGVEAQRKMRHHWITFHDSSQDEFSTPPSLFWFNVALNSIFIVDLVLRVFAWRLQFWCTEDREMFWWNAFDAFLVVLASLDFLPDDMTGGTGNLGLLRSMRLLRAVRILRMVSFFTELRKMVMSFFTGMTQLFWVGTLLGLVLYVFALLFMQGASDEMAKMDRARVSTLPTAPSQWTENGHNLPLLLYYHGTVRDTMVGLFATITGGREWTEVLGTLMLISDLYYWISVMYVLFFAFGFLNIVTATFVERAAVAMAAADEEAEDRRQAVDNHYMEQRILELFGGVRTELTLHELAEVFMDDDIQKWFFTCGIDLSRNITQIVTMLLPKETTRCTAERFLKTLRSFKGPLTNYDFKMLLFTTQRGFNIANAYHKRHQEEMCRVYERQQEDMNRQHDDMNRVFHALDEILKWLPAPSCVDVNV